MIEIKKPPYEKNALTKELVVIEKNIKSFEEALDRERIKYAEYTALIKQHEAYELLTGMENDSKE